MSRGGGSWTYLGNVVEPRAGKSVCSPVWVFTYVHPHVRTSVGLPFTRTSGNVNDRRPRPRPSSQRRNTQGLVADPGAWPAGTDLLPKAEAGRSTEHRSEKLPPRHTAQMRGPWCVWGGATPGCRPNDGTMALPLGSFQQVSSVPVTGGRSFLWGAAKAPWGVEQHPCPLT